MTTRSTKATVGADDDEASSALPAGAPWLGAMAGGAAAGSPVCLSSSAADVIA
jgi:hypothetical protein